MASDYERFKQNRQRVKRRGEAWGLTFDQWLEIWEKSGVYHLRGRGYVLTRFDTDGVWKVNNVQVIPESEAFRRTMDLHYGGERWYG